jgi:sugar O-acyltransferase (sialic acid O-acetyltransferase NeuD family)
MALAKGAASDLIFVDDDPRVQGSRLNGVKVFSVDEALSQERAFCVAIADPSARRKTCEMLDLKGARFFSAIAQGVVTYDDVSIAEGAILCSHVVATSNIRIGKHFHANVHCYIAHDCEFGDFVTLAPHVSCGGRLVIGNGVYVGMGAVIKQGVSGAPRCIGDNAIIGMGAVVTIDVPAGAVVKGNPARI